MFDGFRFLLVTVPSVPLFTVFLLVLRFLRKQTVLQFLCCFKNSLRLSEICAI